MSISKDTLNEHLDSKAVCCCRFEEGTTISAENLEDPNIFPDLIESGLLVLDSNSLTIGEVIGKRLTKTLDALMPITRDDVDAVNEIPTKDKNQKENISLDDNKIKMTDSQNFSNFQNNQTIKIHIGEGKDINLEIPLAAYSNSQVLESTKNEVQSQTNKEDEEKLLRSLKKEYIKVEKVSISDKSSLKDGVLEIDKSIFEKACSKLDLVKSIDVKIIDKDNYNEYSETIMDVQEIACKIDSELGEGVTRVVDGAVILLTGTDENGVQIGEFGSSEGILDRNIMWNRPGAADRGEILIKLELKIKAKTNMERPGPLAAHIAGDIIVNEIRKLLRETTDKVSRVEEFNHIRRRGKNKVLIIKEIMGQGAMHDNLILPAEPIGTIGAVANVDLGNVPVILSPTELLDGGIHALTCIGPASKETSRHYFREPLVIEALKDKDIDLCGIMLVGSPQINSEKFYVSKRLGMMVESMDVDGVIITTEGFGNNHIDFASHHEEVGKRAIPVVGMTFAGEQGALVVGNKYMDAMIDLNKSKQGIENEILANNTLCKEDAIRALAMLKAKINGESIEKATRKYSVDTKLSNLEKIDEDITLVKNEQSLEKSKKRREIYEVEG